jgi:hypothetical protein
MVSIWVPVKKYILSIARKKYVSILTSNCRGFGQRRNGFSRLRWRSVTKTTAVAISR